MHYCCNVVWGDEGVGSGILIRAVQPLANIEIIEKRRGMTGLNVTNGPGKTCQALDIGLNLSGHDLARPPIQLIKKPALLDEEISVGPRIGISKAVHELRRFYITGNPYVSKK